MLDGVTTGYEEQFDFLLSGPAPARPYLLASVPRSGSTFVSHLLWATGCLGAPLEYLNFEPTGPYGFASQSPERQSELWRAVVRRRTSPNGVFGLKGFPIQFEALQRENPALLGEVLRMLLPSRTASRIVWLRRRDRDAHAISYARAILSGIWRKEQEQGETSEPEYSRLAVERAARLIEDQEGSWRAMLGDLEVTPLELWYEDVVADPSGAIASVCDYLGVAFDLAAAVEVPRVERQSQRPARDWVEKHGTPRA
jgi:LPS sulfotransferase NodH